MEAESFAHQRLTREGVTRPSEDRRTYQGHRRGSWTEGDVDVLTELRARERTFDGAYQRTAMGNLAAALVVLKIFTPEFAKIGLIYVILAIMLLLVAHFRRRRSEGDFEDSFQAATSDNAQLKASERLWGRDFRTSGDFVVILGIVCTALILTIFVMIVRLEE